MCPGRVLAIAEFIFILWPPTLLGQFKFQLIHPLILPWWQITKNVHWNHFEYFGIKFFGDCSLHCLQKIGQFFEGQFFGLNTNFRRQIQIQSSTCLLEICESGSWKLKIRWHNSIFWTANFVRSSNFGCSKID